MIGRDVFQESYEIVQMNFAHRMSLYST